MSPTKISGLIRFILVAAVVLLAAIPSTTAYADSFVVNTTDDSDDGQCDSNHCSLREAINAANANPGSDTISFAGLDATGGDVMIQLLGPLNPLIDNGTTIDGTTVLGFANSPAVAVFKGAGVIEEGLAIQGNNCTVRGLSLAGFFGWPAPPDPEPDELLGGAIVVTGSGNLIEGNVIGQGAFPNSRGVWLAGGGNSVIGNVISGNSIGVYITGPNQTIQGNLIGTDPSGTVSVPNGYGIYDELISGGGHQIGGAGQGDRNLISGNTSRGIEIRSNSNTVQNNYIGTDISGSSALGNGGSGLAIYSDGNFIGGAGGGNLLSGNGGDGIFIASSFTNANNVVQSNLVGTDSTGANPIPNQGNGIFYIDGGGSTIGGLSPNLGNTFAFNLYDGADVEGPDQLILGNHIFNNGGNGIDFNGNTIISQNSIYDNGELGILDTWPGVATTLPVLSPSYGVINGSACASCIIELFLAAPDPTGAGEGKEYLGTVTTTSNGAFSFPLPPDFPFCGQVTATATNSHPETSEFSVNVTAKCFRFEPLFLIPIWTFIIIVCGAIGWRIRLRRPESRFGLPGGLLLGVIVGGGLLGLATLLPAVQINLGGEPAVPYSGRAPTCADYLDPTGFSPQDGALLGFAEDIQLSWTPTGVLPEGDLRWIVELVEVGVAGNLHTTQQNDASFADLALTPQAGGSYEWSLTGQQLLQDGQTWLTFCGTETPWTFSIEASQDEEESPPPEPTEEPTEEAACTAPLITALMNMTCRLGPDPAYEELGYLLQGETAVPEGLSMDTFWYWILNPDAQGHCFVASSGVEAVCVEGLPFIESPPLPTETVCLPTFDRAACGDAGGVWSADTGTCDCP